MMKLSAADPSKTDPSAIRAAVKVPSNVRLRTAVLQLSLRSASGGPKQRTFRLQESTEATAVAAREIKPTPSEQVSAWRIAGAELPDLAAFWNEMSGAPKGTRSMKVLVTDVCHVGAPADEAIPVSSYLFTPELGSYVPLVVDVDLRELATQNPEIKLAPCGS
jgi:hypothetical protein